MRRWDGREQTAGTWYEPLTEQDDIDLAVHWVLGRPGFFLNTVGDVKLLPKVLDAASRHHRIPEREAYLSLLRGARSISLPHTGHLAALERPARVAEILLGNPSA